MYNISVYRVLQLNTMFVSILIVFLYKTENFPNAFRCTVVPVKVIYLHGTSVYSVSLSVVFVVFGFG